MPPREAAQQIVYNCGRGFRRKKSKCVSLKIIERKMSAKPASRREVSASPISSTENSTPEGDSIERSSEPVEAGTCARPTFWMSRATHVQPTDRNAITPIKRTICDTSTVKFVIQTTPFLSFFLRIMHKTIRACTKYMLLSYTHYERLFRGNIFGKSIIIIHVKNAHLSYHWLILQYVSYLLGCQIILLCKLL